VTRPGPEASDPLAGRTAFISGASRGIGLEIGRTLARAGANVALIAKTDEPNPKLPGTIHDAAEELTGLGAEVLAIVGDIRDEARVASAVAQTVERFGGIDLCINNASALNLANVAELPIKRYDLLQSVNVRGTYVVTQACLPHLRRAQHAHVLSLSPPMNLDSSWFRSAAYTVSKYGMTIVTLGVAKTERDHGVGANCLWPLTAIATAAVRNLMGGEESITHTRTPQIVADAAAAILRRDPTRYTGNAVLVEDVLAEEGITDLAPYSTEPGQTSFFPDFFVDPARLDRPAEEVLQAARELGR
jgi:NAD(P)-dependent dehydrogenase (short-subunit alcohol dehydrogenase family)